MHHFLKLLILFVGYQHWFAHQNAVNGAMTARWCTTSTGESSKCVDMKSNFAKKGLEPEIDCVVGQSAQDCMNLIKNNMADLITLDGGDVYVAGRDFDMVPIMEETYIDGERGYYAVAVVKKSNPDITINNLQGKKSCHTGIRKTAGWNVPIGFLLEKGHIPPVDCQSDIKSAGMFFNASCVPGVRDVAYNPNNDNPANLCQQCKAGCERNSNEPYYNYAGAFRCLAEGAGDVAFIKPQAVLENTDNNNQDSWALNLASADFELLCPDGSRKAVTEATTCNLAQVPPHAVMTSKIKKSTEITAYQNLLTSAQDIFGDDSNTQGFVMFESFPWQQGKDLIFKDSTIRLDKVNNQNYAQFLGDAYVGTIEGINKCPADTVRWCVISNQELKKCRAMSSAFKGQGLTPEISCYLDVDHAACMKNLKDGLADVVTLDGGDIYQGGKEYNLKPLLAEIYQDKGDANYWAVAVAKSSTSFTINDLKGKKSCHTGIMKTSGWVVPIGHLIDRGDIDASNCDVPQAVGEFFSASCVPGVQTSTYDPYGTNPDSLCELCVGTGGNKCVRNSDEPYYSYNGAFRCLVEDAGEVAFVKHTTVEDTLTSGEFPWANSAMKADFQLLCRDGTRASIDDWKTCNLAKVPSHALVTSDEKTTTERTKISNLLLDGQKQFGHDTNTRGFKMFDSSGYADGGDAGKDLLFKDSTINLQAVGNRDDYDEFLSPEYVADLDAIYCEGSPGSAAYLHPSVALVTLLALLIAFMKAI